MKKSLLAATIIIIGAISGIVYWHSAKEDRYITELLNAFRVMQIKSEIQDITTSSMSTDKLVTMGYLPKADLDRITRGYTIEYFSTESDENGTSHLMLRATKGTRVIEVPREGSITIRDL